mmetsp:Transcript_21383/g.42460  ORF Transcript_21383/g.42460 Transcript_21383/m.42460 type:complete len:87 (-) Transcript_21383:2229-2489(-)
MQRLCRCKKFTCVCVEGLAKREKTGKDRGQAVEAKGERKVRERKRGKNYRKLKERDAGPVKVSCVFFFSLLLLQTLQTPPPRTVCL